MQHQLGTFCRRVESRLLPVASDSMAEIMPPIIVFAAKTNSSPLKNLIVAVAEVCDLEFFRRI